MRKLITLVALTATLGASAVSAQSYSLYSMPSAACISLTRDLSVGSRGSDVRSLQSFLISQNYPGSGSWMLTGYYGQATAAAVRNYQTQRGLAVTGVVDAATRAAIAACGTTGANSYGNFFQQNQYSYTSPFSYTSPYSYSAPYSYASPFTYAYPYQNQNQYGYPYNYSYPYSVPHLTSLSQTTAAPGQSVTVYGSGFEYSGNTVYVGGTTLSNIPSYNGTSLVFTAPTVSGTASVSVGNARGTSNALTLYISGTPSYGCGVYPNPPCDGGYGYGYGCGNYGYGQTDCFNRPISISYITPTSGPIGTSVTVYGAGFSRTGNSVRFGNGIISNLNSFDGLSLTFTVPTQLSGYGYQPVGLGTYDVSVTNSFGAASNKVQFTITGLGSVGAPTISNVSGPNTLPVNSSGTWTINVNTLNNTYTSLSVRWGDEGQYGSTQTAAQSTYITGTQAFTFTHAYAQAGTYTVTFTASNQSGQQNSATASVIVSGTTGNTTLSSITPTSGRVGTQVMLQGTNFTQYDNTVHFGIGGQRSVPSFNNGTMIYYTIPYGVSACDFVGPGCASPTQQVQPGSYPVYVTNANGTTGTVNFTVIQ